MIIGFMQSKFKLLDYVILLRKQFWLCLLELCEKDINSELLD